MVADIYKKKETVSGYRRKSKQKNKLKKQHNVYWTSQSFQIVFSLFFFTIPTCKAQKTSQVKPQQTKIYIHDHDYCGLLGVRRLTLALSPVYRCFSKVQSVCLRITIFNIIVQFLMVICALRFQSEKQLPEGTSIHQKTWQNYHNQMGTWIFLKFIYTAWNTPPLWFIIHIFLCWSLSSSCLVENNIKINVLGVFFSVQIKRIFCEMPPVLSSVCGFVFRAQSYTYHSLKLEERPLWLVVLCTAEAGDRVVLLWVSVVGDTRPGGVDDS